MITLTPEQDKAIDAVRDWYEACMTTLLPSGLYNSRTPFRLFGPAGTGKTTLVRHLADALGLDSIVYGAYTGKAAHVLRSKGIPATTIHSAVYTPRGSQAPEELDALKAKLTNMQLGEISGIDVPDPAEVADLKEEIEQIEAWMRKPKFEFNPQSDWAYADLIVLDEVSMVSATMAIDIESYGVPVLVLGDPAQLPPIEGGGYYTNVEPNVLLTEIHRQALESPVLKLATHVRTGGSWSQAAVPVNLAAAMEADQVLCWKNSTRWALIQKIRAKLGRPAKEPVAGDRVMCLVNNKDMGVFNGQQFEVLSADKFEGDWVLVVRDDEGCERTLQATPEGFQGIDGETRGKGMRLFRGDTGLFTFANAITVHKSQGSEWPHVYVVDQTHLMTRSSPAEKRAWVYTALTRASDRVTLARSGA
jgi:exodeoxyribonuclease-5